MTTVNAPQQQREVTVKQRQLTCLWCGDWYTPKVETQRFCKPSHRSMWNRREGKRRRREAAAAP